MGLFRFALEAFLQIEQPERDTLRALAASAERAAIALETLVAKANEPDPDEGAAQAQVDAVVAKLNAANDRLEAAGHPRVA